MEHRGINRKVISLLIELSDHKKVDIQKNRHIKVTGTFEGKKRVIILSDSPSEHYYAKYCRSKIRRFIASLNLNYQVQLPI